MLKKISLHGFKSFCDKTDIFLGSGITAVVGPNGCGKSNLADAIRWVLGEQNPRVLRCSRISDVIFSGTVRRKAMGMAEVEVLLDGFPLGSETLVKRRLTRDGTAEYRINGQLCRWKDVVDTFLGTGLSHQGYVVIGQGTIHELATGKPWDRRLWIEEASGVSRFKQGRRHIEESLAEARANITRLGDLLVELYAQREKLLSEAEVARQYQDLLREKREMEIFLAFQKLREDSRKVQNLEKRIEAWQNQISSYTGALMSYQEEKAGLEKDLQPSKETLRDLSDKCEALLSNLLDLEKERDATRAKLAFALKELQSRKVRVAVLQKDFDRVSLEIKDLEKKRENLALKMESAEKTLKEAQEQRREKENSWKHLSEEVISLRGQMVNLTGNLNSLAREKEALRKQKEDLAKNLAVESSVLANLEKSIKTREEEKVRLEEDLGRILAEKRDKDESVQKVLSELNARRPVLEKARSQEKNLESRLSLLLGRKKLLEEMRDSYEGYARSTRAVLEAAQRGVLSGILGTPGELFSCEPRYISALSAALGGAAEYIIVENEKAARKAIEYLKKTHSGRCTFLPVELLRPRDMHPAASSALNRLSGVRPLLSLVKYPAEVEIAARYLLGRIVVADNPDVAITFMKESSWATRVVTLSGESFDPGGTITGGDAERHESIFQRKKELDSLLEEEPSVRKALSQLKKEIQALEEDVAQLTRTFDRLREEKSLIESRENQTRSHLGELDVLIDNGLKQIEEVRDRIGAFHEKDETLDNQLSMVLTKEKEISEQIGALETQLSRCEEALKDHLARDTAPWDTLDEATRVKESLEREISSVNMRMESLSSERSSLERNLFEEDKESRRLMAVIHDLEASESSLSGKIAALEKDLTALKDATRKKSAEIEASEGRLAFVNGEILRLSREIESLGSRLDEGKKDLLVLQEALSETAGDIKRKYGDVTGGYSEPPDMTREKALAMIQEIESRINSLGNLNLRAAEELDALEERLKAIQKEKKDVEDAIAQLEDAKKHVERKIQASFTETFEKVSENFGEIFQRLFGGGKGALVLDDNEGVDISCQVPGRKGKDLNLLSGGERSLCGIALVFSILKARPSPLIVLDEVDAALDGANVVRFSQFLKDYSRSTQFIVITHKESTMESADVVYGVTMEEPGVSKVFSIRIEPQQ